MLRVFFIVGLVVFLPQQSLHAQTDYRIDYRTNQQSGRMFDANNRAIGGRFNTRISSGRFQFDAGVTANNLIQGNVTGLGGFQGGSPIPGPNQFRVVLPSAGLANFRARSVDISQLRSGRPAPTGSAYFDQSNTFADLGMIRAQRNIPGSPTMLSPGINVNRGVPGVMGSPLDDDLDRPLDARGSRINSVLINLRNNRVGSLRQVRLDGSEVGGRGDFANADVFASIAQSTLFGSPGQLANSRAASSDQSSNNTVQDIINRSGRDSVSRRIAREDLLNRSNQIRGNESANGTSASGESIGDSSTGLQLGITQRTPFGDTPTTGDDLYTRMIDALRDRAPTSDGPTQANPMDNGRNGRRGDPRERSFPTGAEGIGERSSPFNRGEANEGRDIDGIDARSDEVDEAAERRRKRYESIIDSPIKSFVAGSRSLVNYHMSLGEAALRRGEFYLAARHFESAMTADGDNPLPLLGRGHSLAAAGDYMTAVASIKMGIQRFPEIAQFALDLPALVGQGDIFDRRRADLESLLQVREQYELRFLLGYLETYSGLREDGLNDLQKAARLAPPDSIVARFPDMLLGRDRPVRDE